MDQAIETSAFNEGAQARIDGVAVDRCPHKEDRGARKAWKRGWEHADANWAREARWLTRMLPIPV